MKGCLNQKVWNGVFFLLKNSLTVITSSWEWSSFLFFFKCTVGVASFPSVCLYGHLSVSSLSGASGWGQKGELMYKALMWAGGNKDTGGAQRMPVLCPWPGLYWLTLLLSEQASHHSVCTLVVLVAETKSLLLVKYLHFSSYRYILK